LVAVLVVLGATYLAGGRSNGRATQEWIPEIAAEETPHAATEPMEVAPPASAGGAGEAGPMSQAQLQEGVPVEVAAELVQTLGVRTARVTRTDLVKVVRSVGRLDYNEKTLAVVSARVAGRVERLAVDVLGSVVRRGDLLLWLYSPELVSAQREYLIALRSAARMQAIAASSPLAELQSRNASLASVSRERLALWGLTDEQVDAIPEKGVSTYLPIHAPVSGTVVQKNVVEGVYVAEGTPFYTIADLSTVWLYVDVYESDLPWVDVGDRVVAHIPAYSGRAHVGRVALIEPFVDARTRTTRVRVDLPNPNGSLRPGMFAHAEMTVELGESLAVPEDAVIFSGRRNFVVKSLGAGRFQPKEVVVGPLADGHYPVRLGVAENDVVVTAANFLIDSESNLRAAVAKMAPASVPPGAAPAKGEPAHVHGAP
jgi:Cu(I)/Ag(I) efflux system membrane fusion protein